MKVTLVLWPTGTSGRPYLLIHSLSSPEEIIVNIHVINKPDGEGELESQSQDCFDENLWINLPIVPCNSSCGKGRNLWLSQPKHRSRNLHCSKYKPICYYDSLKCFSTNPPRDNEGKKQSKGNHEQNKDEGDVCCLAIPSWIEADNFKIILCCYSGLTCLLEVPEDVA